MNTVRNTDAASHAAATQALGKGPLRLEVKDALYKAGAGIHRAVFGASKGRIFGKVFGMPVAELLTTGRRSGEERSTMLAVPIAEVARLVLVASLGGDDRHPAWYLNLRANPEVRVTTAGSTRAMMARAALGGGDSPFGSETTASCDGVDPCTPCICERLSTLSDESYARSMLCGSTTLKTAVEVAISPRLCA